MVFEQKFDFLASGFLFTSGNFTLFFKFFNFSDRIFFSMLFPIHSLFFLGLFFSLNPLSICRYWFFVHMQHFGFDF